MADDVSAPFPDVELRANSIVTVTLDDPAAIITKLVVHGWQQAGAPINENPFPLHLLPGSSEA